MKRLRIDEVRALYDRPLADLKAEAWQERWARFPPLLRLAAPSAKRYQTEGFRNSLYRFVDISLTGRACQLMCEHCRGKLLATMQPAISPEALRRLADELVGKGCQGVLLSGGADMNGQVPIVRYLDAIAYLKERGLRVIVHTGLLDSTTAYGLKAASVDQVLLDVIGDEASIRQVCHLDKTPEDYQNTLFLLKEAGLAIAPHVVIGLHFGQIRGELEALRQITSVQVEAIILVVLSPLPHTPMRCFTPPPSEAVGKLVALARLLNPATPIALGCARPPGQQKVTMECHAIAAGINTLAYPSVEAIAYAHSLGLSTEFTEMCCSLL